MLDMRRRRISIRLRLFFCAFGLLAGTAFANDAEWCEQQWVAQEVYPKGYDAPTNRNPEVDDWLALSDRCKGTIAWEARLAMAYVNLDRPSAAREALAQLQNSRQSMYGYLIDLAEIDLMITELMDSSAGSTVPSDKAQAIEDRFTSHMTTYYSNANLEDAVDALIAFGSFEGSLGEFEAAVELLEMADQVRKPARGKLALYRNLTVNYAALGKFRDAEDAARSALRLSPIVMTSPNFVYALARSQSSLGLRDEAQASIRKLAQLRPDVALGDEFKVARAFVDQKARAAKPD